jgi:predicted dinucleotide-binding enzyme
MKIGTIGAGAIGASFAHWLAQAGIPAILSNSHGPDSLADLVARIGGPIRAATRDEAAAQDLVLVAVNWLKLPAAVGGLPDFGGRIVIDANNPIISVLRARRPSRTAIDRGLRGPCARRAGGEGI